MQKEIKIGTRASELALVQTKLVIAALEKEHPGLRCTICPIKTAGDARTDLPLQEVNKATGTQDKGVFIAALEEALAEGKVDCAVHSLKDMPGQSDARFTLAAYMPREERGDVLVVKPGARMDFPTIATGSVRRAHFMRCYRSGRCRIVPTRGNVQTRLRKLLENDEVDATLLARAGLNRLGYTGHTLSLDGQNLHLVDLSEDSFMPALGQGTIVVETRSEDTAMQQILAPINDEHAATEARCERAFLALLGADCSVPVGGYATVQGKALMFRAIYFTPEGRPIRLTRRGFASDPEGVARQAYEDLRARLD